MKKVLALLLALTMVFALCACGTEKNDAGFITNLQKGLESRMKIENGLETYPQREDLTKAVAAEKKALGEYAEYTFVDPELQQLAEDYFTALNTQEEGIAFYSSDYSKFSEKYYTDGYYARAKVLCKLYDNYGLSINDKYALVFSEMMHDGRYYNALEDIANSNLVLESLGGTRSEITFENTSEFDYSNVMVDFNLYDDDGMLVATASTYIDSFKSGAKVKKEVYAQTEFASAEISMSVYSSSAQISTEYFPVEYVNNMIINIELVTDIPQEFSYGSSRRIYSKTMVNSFSYEIDNWYDGKAYVKFSISGEKTYDDDGEDGTHACEVSWKLRDMNGVVVDSGAFYVNKLTVGEAFLEETSSASNVPVGTYTLELTNYEY